MRALCALLLLGLAASPATGQTETARLTPEGPTGSEFGADLSISGDHAVVGAPFDHERDYGVGAVYVYERGAGTGWALAAKINGLLQQERFGTSVAVDGNRLVVGATRPYRLEDSGVVYFFERDASGAWARVGLFRAAGASTADAFGAAASISGDRAVIGAPEDGAAGVWAGAAHVFERQADGTWIQTATLRADDVSAEDRFGQSVAVDGGRVLVGAPCRGCGSGRTISSRSRGVYVFDLQPDGTWAETGLLVSGTTDDDFASDVALSGDRAVVGASADSRRVQHAGAAHVFDLQPDGAWVRTATLTANDAAERDGLGRSLAVVGDRVVVGAAGVDGPQAADRGAAYVFARDGGGVWEQVAMLAATDGPGRFLGAAVAASETEALVGSDVTDAAYVFDLASLPVAVTDGPDAAAALHVWPNPMLRSARVAFSLAAPAVVRVAAYDVLGREVAVLADGPLAAGRHERAFGDASLPAGVYVVRVQTPARHEVVQVTVVR